MAVPYLYAIQNLRHRKTTIAATVAGVALVVFVFSAVLMMSNGIDSTLASTGSEDNVIITRKGANGEIASIVTGDVRAIATSLPQVARTPEGEPIASAEPVVVINLNKASGGMSNVTVRGVSSHVSALRPGFRIIRGRAFNPALRELVAAEEIVKRFPGGDIGSKVKFAGDLWEVVGTFECGGGFNSEMWGDADQLRSAPQRGNTCSSLTLKLDRRESLPAILRAFDEDVRLKQFEAITEKEYFARQSQELATFIRILGIFVTVVFSAGATLGAMITMYGAVAGRTVEIGTLRSLGFRRRSILAVFLAESMLISLVGALLGVVLASSLSLVKLSTMNFNSFSEIVFGFTLSPGIVIGSILFGVAMGFLGGFLPAIRAARMNIINALRAA